jgi:sulfatase maturation enzyme AslB (radical SAM superfamily)
VTNRNHHDYLVRRIDDRGGYEDLLAFPRYFEIETVNACNARCPMCTIDDWTRKTPIMKMDLFRKLADEICDHRDVVKRVNLYRDGEPLLDKKLPDRMAILKEGGINEVAISTNVALLDEERARAILEAGIDMIILSIDSLDKEVFEKIRVRLIHEEVMANALRFIGLRNQIRPSCKVWVRMIRQETNVDEWPAFEAYWRQHLAENDRVNYHDIHNWGGQLDGFKAIVPTREPNLPCIALWSLMVIFGDGRVPLCNVDYNNLYPSGDVSKDSIANVWRSHIYNQRRLMHLGGDKAGIPICKNCNVWDEPPDRDKVAPEVSEAVWV